MDDATLKRHIEREHGGVGAQTDTCPFCRRYAYQAPPPVHEHEWNLAMTKPDPLDNVYHCSGCGQWVNARYIDEQERVGSDPRQDG